MALSEDVVLNTRNGMRRKSGGGCFFREVFAQQLG